MSQQNIRVAVRCRPLNKSEIDKSVVSCVECTKDKVTVKDRINSKVFTFDHVFGPYSKQIDVYKTMVAPLIDEILTGYNCTIFAYGQTGSGKTFTMTGERSDKLRYAWENDPLVGIIPRALSHLFETLEKTDSDFSVRVSFLEVYNEELFDLLSLTETNRLMIYDDINRKGSIIVKGLREVVVLDKQNVHSVIERGLARRQTASTLLNAQSSRSHSIFTVTVHIKETNPTTNEELLRIGKLHLVDLAGSECVGRSGAIEKRAREAGSINQSLLTLGRVITALVDHAPHVPYRESKLTRLLQDSLGGKTKTSIIATIGPSAGCLEETLSTLDYAHRAKNIQNRPEINARLNKTDLVRGYNEELERLRRDLEAARTKTGVFLDEENYQALQTQITQQRARICDLEERREILEYDLNQLQEMFSIAQSELAESRECRNQIENELSGCQANLEKLRLRLIKIRLRLEEEEHLRREHQKTENVLREQAEYLLSTSKTAMNDLTNLHSKLETLQGLDSTNRQRLSFLTSTWTTENLNEPINDLSQLQQKWDNFSQAVRSTLVDIRVKEQKATAQLLERQESMEKQFTEHVASDWMDVVRKVHQFASDQTEHAKQNCEKIFLPYSNLLKNLWERITVHTTKMNESLVAYHKLFDTLFDGVSEVMGKLDQYVIQCTAAIHAQKQYYENAVKSLTTQRSREDILLQTLHSTLKELSNVRSETQNLLTSEFESSRQRTVDLCHENLDHFAQTKSQLKVVTSEVDKTRRDITENQHHQLAKLHNDLDSLSGLHGELRGAVNLCFETVHQRVSDFTEIGLGAELRLRAEEWKVDSESASEGSSLDHLHKVIRSYREGVVALVDDSIGEVLRLENLNGDVAHEFSSGFTNIRDRLSQFPQNLQDQLNKNMQQYQPTGQTPQRQCFDLPRELVRTASHRRLLAQFRSVRDMKNLDEVSTTPLPDNNSSFGDSLEVKSVVQTLDTTQLCLEDSYKENQANTSGLGSEISENKPATSEGTDKVASENRPLELSAKISSKKTVSCVTPIQNAKRRRSRKKNQRKA